MSSAELKKQKKNEDKDSGHKIGHFPFHTVADKCTPDTHKV